MPVVEVRYLFNNGDVVLKPFNFPVRRDEKDNL